MSKSNPTPEKPCRKYIEYKGDKGTFFYYDTDLREQVELSLPIYFIWLDELSTITGYSKEHKCGIYSNEVRKTTTDILKVKTFKGGESVTGLYADIKGAITVMGGKFTRSVYAMLIEEGKPGELVNFRFHGAAFAAWMNKKFNPDKFIIGITGFTEATTGNVTYKVPVFAQYNLKPELNQAAIALDKDLQAYLNVIPEEAEVKAEAEEEAEAVELPPVTPAGIDDLPF